MKGLSRKQQEKVNDFTRRYIKPGKKINWQYIFIDGKNGKKHSKRVTEVCLDLAYELKTIFATEVELETSLGKYNPDIICPLHVKPIIEVRHSETEAMSIGKEIRIPEELRDEIIFINTKDDYELKMIQ